MTLEVGIFIAIGVNILFILYETARPNVTVESFEVCYNIKNAKYVNNSLFFLFFFRQSKVRNS